MPSSERERWAASGAMALTGRRDGPPLIGTGAAATAVHEALAALPNAPGVEVLGERAALTGRTRNAPWSVGGAFRIVPAADGWFGISLARPSDVDLLPALLELPVADPWPDLMRAVRRRSAAALAQRARVLGLAAAEVPATPRRPSRPPVLVTSGGPRRLTDAPLVVNLGALWAGPLCARLLRLAGARVMKIESRARPDGSRRHTPAFFERMEGGHELRILDFDRERDELHRLVRAADVVIEASRPRALRQLGVDAAEEVARGAVWVSITAAGRADELRAGFGDDIAAGAGLVAWDGARPVPMGDALADPLSGATAAAAAVAALREPSGALLDVSMHDLCAAAAVRLTPDSANLRN